MKALVFVLALLAFAAPARAQAPADSARVPAPADSALGGFLQSLHDSTDAYFGRTVAPTDTAGLDSALYFGLAHPGKERSANPLRFAYGPWLGFNRVDGPRYGAEIGLGRRRSFGRFEGRLGYAVGADTWLGSGRWELARRFHTVQGRFDLDAGRATASMDRDRADLVMPMTYALLSGSDTRRYLRRDGLEAALEAEHPSWRGRIGYRDMLERPLPVTARWSLFADDLVVPDNLAARRAHVHELGFRAAVRTPGPPFTLEGEYLTSSRKIGSDAEYRRTRVALGGDIGIGGIVALVPQVAWGRLTGEPTPQAAFYLGGITTLRSIEGGSYGGTGLALGRLDLLEMPDLLEVLHVPHPAMFPIQAGAFVASGAVWGADPYGGPTVPGVDWPRRELFRSEAGVSLLYRPGLPDPSSYLQINWAWPIGSHSGGPRLSVAYTRGLDLVHKLGGDDL